MAQHRENFDEYTLKETRKFNQTLTQTSQNFVINTPDGSLNLEAALRIERMSAAEKSTSRTTTACRKIFSITKLNPEDAQYAAGNFYFYVYNGERIYVAEILAVFKKRDTSYLRADSLDGLNANRIHAILYKQDISDPHKFQRILDPSRIQYVLEEYSFRFINPLDNVEVRSQPTSNFLGNYNVNKAISRSNGSGNLLKQYCTQFRVILGIFEISPPHNCQNTSFNRRLERAQWCVVQAVFEGIKRTESAVSHGRGYSSVLARNYRRTQEGSCKRNYSIKTIDAYQAVGENVGDEIVDECKQSSKRLEKDKQEQSRSRSGADYHDDSVNNVESQDPISVSDSDISDQEATDNQEMEETNDKTGPLRLSEANRKEIYEAYKLMDRRYMWKLTSGKVIEDELYKLGRELEFEHAVHSFILDIDDELVADCFTETELREIELTPIPEVPELSDEVDHFLNKFVGKTNLKEIRQLIKEASFGIDYDYEKHHDMDYICLALHALVREIESGKITDANLENWFNCHVWSMVFDQAFGNLKTIAVVGYFPFFF
ncbi:hypothetical protein RclHR1_01600004 [Rhizophagus clarus]|uniref:Uncharacterized protein n=1 Tax=Rhizophagus clarus TaxID=94130 RepID=A0A2Z6QKR0_9GLOM|nr:hypothetical protein RclHR1_01600004 [Rhizophagus clarus]